MVPISISNAWGASRKALGTQDIRSTIPDSSFRNKPVSPDWQEQRRYVTQNVYICGIDVPLEGSILLKLFLSNKRRGNKPATTETIRGPKYLACYYDLGGPAVNEFTSSLSIWVTCTFDKVYRHLDTGSDRSSSNIDCVEQDGVTLVSGQSIQRLLW